MAVDSIGNPNQRTLCALVLDASGSMNNTSGIGGSKIDQLNRGLATLIAELKEDPVASDRVALAMILVGGPTGGAKLLLDWTDVRELDSFPIKADGTTPLGEGVLLALDLIEQGKQKLKADGISYLRPWMIVITDGEPTDNSKTWIQATNASRAAESSNKCIIFPIAVDGANLSKLGELTTSQVKQMASVRFAELFQWLSASLSAVSSSAPGATLRLPSTDPWAGVKI
jgi:uncharacterized protein YegL